MRVSLVAVVAIAGVIALVAGLLPMAQSARAEGSGEAAFMLKHPSGKFYQAVVATAEYFNLHRGTRLNVFVADGAQGRYVDLYLNRFVINGRTVLNGGCRMFWLRQDAGSCSGAPITSYWETTLVDPLAK